LIGAATSDDAGVYRIDDERALVQTVDFFTPIVDDPYRYGQIAAANALSDVYAMGGRPLTAMNLIGMPTDDVPLEVINQILRGGADKILEADCVLAGGHSIRNPEPIYGLSVTGIVHPNRIISNAGGRPGDVLILTKPLGTGILSTGLKRGLVSADLEQRLEDLMSELNLPGAILAERGLVHGGTDITGFGLLGHLISLCRSSGVAAEVDASNLPTISPEVMKLIEEDCIPGGTRKNLETANSDVTWNGTSQAIKYLLADAQTSGGLLLCISQDRRQEVLECLIELTVPVTAEVGRLVSASESPTPIVVRQE
jgi:selenide,water dikinase